MGNDRHRTRGDSLLSVPHSWQKEPTENGRVQRRVPSDDEPDKVHVPHNCGHFKEIDLSVTNYILIPGHCVCPSLVLPGVERGRRTG